MRNKRAKGAHHLDDMIAVFHKPWLMTSSQHSREGGESHELFARARAGDTGGVREFIDRIKAGDLDALVYLFGLACEQDRDALEGLVEVALGEGPPEAKERLIEWAREYLRNFAKQLSLHPSDDPSELAQSCARRLMEHLPDIQGRNATAFIAYLKQMARNWQIDKFRRRKTRKEQPLDEDSSGLSGGTLPARELTPWDPAGDRLNAILDRLQEPERKLARLKYVEGLTYGEVGQQFDPPWSADRVRMRLSRALRDIGGSGEEDEAAQ